MDEFAPAFVAHNIPLILVSGLLPRTKEGVNLQDDTNRLNVGPEEAAILLGLLQNIDASNLDWNSREFTGKNRFRVKAVGRDYTLPPRSTHSISIRSLGPNTKPVLRSTLSPLNPESALFPDGLIDLRWIEKHQEFVPCALVSFYKFQSDPKLYQQHDEQLKIAIRRERNNLNQSGYKSYLVVALISDNATIISPEIEERLSRIRRETGLDNKTSLLFLSSQQSNAELKGSVSNLITKIYPPCIEYYRDLSKHSRRKKNKGAVSRPLVSSTSVISQHLTVHGWNFRYDFKLGVFAEFRQEMESALRSYEGAYETLLGTDILDSISSSSPRWNEARCLADVLSFRMVRCLLWNGNYSTAVRRWALHKERMKESVYFKGKNLAVTSWGTWKARWATLMAETIKRVSIPEFSGSAKYILPEKNFAASGKVKPWEYLHHPGYWFRIASKYLIAQQELAHQISEKNCYPHISSVNARMKSNESNFNTYSSSELCRENLHTDHQEVDYSTLVLDSLSKAILEFRYRKQLRMVQELQLLSANEFMRKESWDEAFKLLISLSKNMSYRKECWWSAVEEILWALRKVAIHVGNTESILLVDWELMSNDFTYNPNLSYDFSNTLKGLKLQSRPSIVIHNTELHSFLRATYTFDSPKGKVGDLCLSQFVVSSNAVPSATPIKVSKIVICFEGKMGSISLKHNDLKTQSLFKEGSISMRRIAFHDPNKSSVDELSTSTSLIFPPGSTTIFEFSNYLREAGEVKVVAAKFFISMDLFDVEYTHKIRRTNAPSVWWGEKSTRKRSVRSNASSITVLPKPPKLELRLKKRDNQYCRNELLSLQLVILNEEEVDAIIALEAQVLGDQAPKVSLEVELPHVSDSSVMKSDKDELDLKGIFIGKVITGRTANINIVIPPFELPGKYELLLKANYRLITETEIPMLKTVSIELQIIEPFEATYDFSPRIHPDPWPSLFTHVGELDETDNEETRARGIPQRWCLTTHCTSLLNSDVIIKNINTEINSIHRDVRCLTTNKTAIPEGGLKLPPVTLFEVKFDIITQNLNVDDRSAKTIDKFLVVSWHRNTPNSAINRTKLSIPRLHVSGSEPRVISEISFDHRNPLTVSFNIMIENPSHHFLSFGLSMESSEKFAFSGPKQSILQLLPLSRKMVQYQILPYERGRWLGPIHCVIRDRYFQKILRVLPTEKMIIDKEGIMIWIPNEGDF